MFIWGRRAADREAAVGETVVMALPAPLRSFGYDEMREFASQAGEAVGLWLRELG